MKTTHTPGPWIFAYGSVYRADTLNDENSARIALMDRNEPSTMPTERDANARLIAAAPELLEALKRIRRTSVKETFYGDVHRFQEWLDGFTAEAISKAEGQS